MNCPFCNFKFNVLLSNAKELPDVAPILCGDCGAVSLLVNGKPRKMTPGEAKAIKESPSWEFMQKAKAIVDGRNRASRQ